MARVQALNEIAQQRGQALAREVFDRSHVSYSALLERAQRLISASVA